MEHNYVRDDNFNILTISYDKKKGQFFLTGETRNGIEIGDSINYIINEQFDTLEVAEITQRRDSGSFPLGNNLHYECWAKALKNLNAPQKNK